MGARRHGRRPIKKRWCVSASGLLSTTSGVSPSKPLDPLVALSVGISTSPGAYAVLIGAGVSLEAGVPTGEQILQSTLQPALPNRNRERGRAKQRRVGRVARAKRPSERVVLGHP